MLPKLFLLFSLVLSLAVAHSEHSVVSPDTVKRLEDSLARRRLKTRKCDSSIAAFTAGRKAKRNGGAETVGVVKKRWNPTYDSIQNTTCILSTDGEQGPYWVPGELYLQNLTENQPGVKILMDIGVMDVNTCEPAENLLVDIWNANATGVYSGMAAEDTLGETWLRGLYPTNSAGLVEFQTVYPGFYAGRSNHLHARVHANWTVEANGTVYTDGVSIHTGQLFWPTDMNLYLKNNVYPYTADTNNYTTNNKDRVFAQENTAGYWPVVSLEYIGANVTEGFIAYATLVVDPSETLVDGWQGD